MKHPLNKHDTFIAKYKKLKELKCTFSFSPNNTMLVVTLKSKILLPELSEWRAETHIGKEKDVNRIMEAINEAYDVLTEYLAERTIKNDFNL